MKNLNKFLSDNNYELSDTLTYNSYKAGTRSETRSYDSISVSEILNLIIDPNFENIKKFIQPHLDTAMSYGTAKHTEYENYAKGAKLDNDKINRQFILALIKEGIEIKETEKMFSHKLSNGLPVTGTIDVLGEIDNDKVVIDYKNTKGERNLKSKKQWIQISAYTTLSGLDKGGLLYLNKKKYKLKMLSEEDMIFYKLVWQDLLQYVEYLFENNLVFNLK